MNLRRICNWVIALTVTAGLLAAPLASSVFATSHAAISGKMQAIDEPVRPADMMTAGLMASDVMASDKMASDMACCPDEGKANDCPSCPLLALCMLSISIPLPADANALARRDALLEIFATRNDAWVQGLGGHPPDHPPRNNV